jgi:carbamoylphosphate synthase small subunit
MDSERRFQVLFVGGYSESIKDPSAEAKFLALSYPATEAEGVRSMDWIKSDLPRS